MKSLRKTKKIRKKYVNQMLDKIKVYNIPFIYKYGVHMNGLAWSRMENELFPTKEELLKSL